MATKNPITSDLASLPFPEAAETWLQTRRAYRLQEISGDQIRAYQQMLETCGPFAINHECSVLQQMLKRIERWPEIAHAYQALPLPKEKRGRALAPEEKEKFLRGSEQTRCQGQ